MDRIAVVVLNWNGMEDTRLCLASVAEQRSVQFHIVLVDNGSTEAGTSKFLDECEKQYTEKITIIRNDTNKGFAGGVNTGIRIALEDPQFAYVALINNDAIIEHNWLAGLLEAAKKRSAGITTGLLLHYDGKTIDSTGDWYSVWGLPFPRNRGDEVAQAPDSGEVFGASGGGSMYSTKMLEQIGLFDEVFFAYYEDADISFRAQLHGWKVYYTDKAIAYHKQGASSSKIPGFTVYQTFKNLPLLYTKNVPRRLLLSIGIRFWTAYLLMFGNAIKNGGGWFAVKGYLVSVYYFWSSALPLRFTIQKTSTVKSDVIYKKLWHDLPPDQSGIRRLRALFKH